MDEAQNLLLKRPVTVKVIVTSRWKEEVQQQLQNQTNQLDDQIQQLSMQGQRAIADIQKQALTPLSSEAQQQIDSIQSQVNQKKSELLDKKNQLLQQLQQIQLLELEQEVAQGQMESFFNLKQGDNIVTKLNVEIVVRDGIVQEIRGEI